MKKKGNLFALVQSLTKSEKRYFKLFISGRDTVYLRLFDYLDACQDFEEAAVKKHFHGEPFVRQLNVAKSYLYNLIMKALRSYHGRISKEGELKELLRSIEILYHKELHEQCQILIAKGKRIARNYEKFPALVELLSWERKVLLARAGPQVSQDALNRIIMETEQVLTQINHLNRYLHLTVNLFDMIKDKGYKKVMNHTLIKDPLIADSVSAKILYYHIQYAYYAFLPAKHHLAVNSINQLIKLLEDNPEMIRDDPSAYLTALTNKVGIYLFSKKHEKIPSLLEKIRGVPSRYRIERNTKLTLKSILKTYNVELEMHRDLGDTTTGIKLIAQIASFLKQHKNNIPREYELLFSFQFAYIFFLPAIIKSHCTG